MSFFNPHIQETDSNWVVIAALEGSMTLRNFAEDSLAKTEDQIRESTRIEYESAMRDFINVIGNMDYQQITFKHGERFRQACLDKGNSPATVAKKLRYLKRLFQLSVDRDQLEVNPLRRVRVPRTPKGTIRTYSPDECERIIRAAREIQNDSILEWDLLITLALATAMRRSELLNLVWADIDFATKKISVNAKKSTSETWEWHIKDADSRTLPVTEEVLWLLADLQGKRPDGYPYVFVPPERYDHIQGRRKQGKWTFCDARNNVVNNFTRQFQKMLWQAAVRRGTFHDLRRTALKHFLLQGLGEYDVMTLAGHSDFSTTHKFYLGVSDDLVDRARHASSAGLGRVLARVWHAPPNKVTEKEGGEL